MRSRLAQLNGHDAQDIAARLFKVFPEAVTNRMIARVHVLRIGYLVSDPDWPTCPTCKQSATGRYWKGLAGCTRCGWSEGGNKSKHGDLFT